MVIQTGFSRSSTMKLLLSLDNLNINVQYKKHFLNLPISPTYTKPVVTLNFKTVSQYRLS